MKREAIGCSKMKRLCRYLDIPQWQAVGILESIWFVTARETPAGNIGKLSDEDIALAIDYRADETKLIEALVKSGWLDRHPIFRLIIHDWWDHADDAVHMRMARGKRYFACGSSPKLGRLPTKERYEAEEFYSRSACSRIDDACSRNGNSCRPPEPEPEPVPVPEITAAAANAPLTTQNCLRIVRKPELPPPPALAQPDQEEDLSQSLTALREKFPGSDLPMTRRIMAAARGEYPDTTDAELAIAIRSAYQRSQKSAALYLHTVPGFIGTIRKHRHEEAERAWPRIRHAWIEGNAEIRAQLELEWPEYRNRWAAVASEASAVEPLQAADLTPDEKPPRPIAVLPPPPPKKPARQAPATDESAWGETCAKQSDGTGGKIIEALWPVNESLNRLGANPPILACEKCKNRGYTGFDETTEFCTCGWGQQWRDQKGQGWAQDCRETARKAGSVLGKTAARLVA
jgi:hypothetical protein